MVCVTSRNYTLLMNHTTAHSHFPKLCREYGQIRASVGNTKKLYAGLCCSSRTLFMLLSGFFFRDFKAAWKRQLCTELVQNKYTRIARDSLANKFMLLPPQ